MLCQVLASSLANEMWAEAPAEGFLSSIKQGRLLSFLLGPLPPPCLDADVMAGDKEARCFHKEQTLGEDVGEEVRRSLGP